MEAARASEIAGNLWDYNLTKVVVIDVSDDYRLMRSPMPSECYPVLKEVWVPTYQVDRAAPGIRVEGYLYDWHESPTEVYGTWYVGVVHSGLLLKSEIAG
jgi:hypothetical protein